MYPLLSLGMKGEIMATAKKETKTSTEVTTEAKPPVKNATTRRSSAKKTEEPVKTSIDDIDFNNPEVVAALMAKLNIKQEPKKETVKHIDPHTLIPCMSVCRGELGYISDKSHNEYFWGDYGDIVEVEYQDIQFLKLKKSTFLYKPWFIVLDTSVLDEKKDAELIKMTNLYKRFDTMEELFNLETSEIENILVNAPAGFQEAAYYTADSLIKRGALDSMYVVALINKLLGVELSYN